MNSAERFAVREKMVRDLRKIVEGHGGDLSDGFSILAIATMEIHAAHSIVAGRNVDRSKDDLLDMVRNGYPDAYDVISRQFRDGAH